MKKLIWVLSLLLAGVASFSQNSRADSITRLINAADDEAAKARLLIARSRVIAGPQTAQALADAQQALALFQQIRDEKGQVDAYLQLSGLYSRQSKFLLALSVDSTAFRLAGKIDYPQGLAISCSNMGRNLQQTGRFEEAKDLLTRSLQLLRTAGLERETAEVNNRLGVIYRRISDFKASLSHFDEGIAVAKKFGMTPNLANLLMNKANTLNESGRYDEAISLHLESLRIKESLNDERGMIQSYNNLANVYTVTSEPDRALRYYRLSASLSEKTNNRTSVALAYNNLANLLSKLARYDSVEFYYKRSLDLFTETHDQPGIALVYNNMGNYYLDREEYLPSLEALKHSLTIREKSRATYDIASTTNTIGVVLRKLKRYDEAEEYMMRSLDMVREEDGSELTQNIYRTLGEHYRETGDFEKAATYQAKYISIHDTLFTEAEAVNMIKAQSRYELEKKENQILLEKKEKELNAVLLTSRNRTILFMTGGLMLLLFALAMYVRSYYQKKKAASVLEEKNRRIELLVRELHHRVKNNLQVVSGLLSLQSNRTESESAKLAMEEGRSRINAMALIHQRLYMDKDLASVDVKDYLENLSKSLAGSFGFDSDHIHTNINLPENNLDVDLAMPIGLIVNELVTNAFKHAFSGINDPAVNIHLYRKRDHVLELQVSDNGSGLKEEKAGSFGMKLVQTLVKQINGTMTVKQDPGTAYTIEISA